MLSPTKYSIDVAILNEAVSQSHQTEFKYTINQPTGDFFYDPWEINPELIGTVWEDILNSLPVKQGEARIIVLKPGTSYYCHADADDRWHLNLQSEYGYLLDLDNSTMYQLHTDGVWYEMDAGCKHSAANFGHIDRIQLVVRHLLNRNVLVNPVDVKIVLKIDTPDFRYQFDSTISPWLNRANKQGVINNFKFVGSEVSFSIEQDCVERLKQILPDIFEIVQ
jgi:hypothetical protein